MAKSGPFGPNPPYKTPFLAKSEPFGRFGCVSPHTPPPPGYGPASNHNIADYVCLETQVL